MFSKEGWENWYKESEEGRTKETNSTTKEISKNISVGANIIDFKGVKSVSSAKHSKGNILEPIVGAVFNYFKWFASCWI